MSKREIIENLYNSGKITFEEAITLASVPGEEPLVIFKDGQLEGPTTEHQNDREETINEFIKQIVDEYYDEECDPDKNLAFDSARCVKVMNDLNWTWNFKGVPTLDEFKEELRSIVKIVIDNLIRKYNSSRNEDPIHFEAEPLYYGTETGGIKVEGWIEVDGIEKTLIIKPQFILTSSEFYLENDKLKKLL